MTTGMNSAPLDRLMVFTGNANPRLAQDVAKHLNLPIGRAIVGKFSDGEVLVELIENVRGKDAFVLQSTCAPTNDNLMELLVMIDALKRSSAARVTAAIPYFGYARQDRRPRSARVAISAKVVANMLASVGVARVLTMDLHADQIQGFFDMPVDNIYAAPVLLDEGATKVVAYCTHPVLSGGAVERIAGSPLDELVVTDTIPLRDEARQCKKIRQLSVAGLLAETSLRFYTEESVISLFIE